MPEHPHASPIACPDCQTAVSRCLGKLPAVAFFAGRMTAAPIDGGRLMHCTACDLRFRHSSTSDAEIASLYAAAGADAWASPVTARAEWSTIRSLIESSEQAPTSVLDVGCHSGALLASLGDGFERAGVEPNAAAAQRAAEHFKGPVWPSLEDIPIDRRFDVVVSTDVIEHVRSPKAFLASLMRLTTPGGLVIVSTGRADGLVPRLFGAHWWYCFYPEHISLVSQPWFASVCQAMGWQITRIAPFSYQPKTGAAWLVNAAQTVAYGLMGSRYLSLVRSINRLLGQDYPVFPKGMGVSEDHFVVALRSKG